MARRPETLHPDVAPHVTLQDYSARPAIDGVALLDLQRFVDDGGSFLELGRLSKGITPRRNSTSWGRGRSLSLRSAKQVGAVSPSPPAAGLASGAVGLL